VSRRRLGLLLALLTGSALAAPAREELAAPAAPNSSEPAYLPQDVDQDITHLEKRQTELRQEAAERHALAIARGRAYVRLVRAGLLPLSDGFEAMATHASRLERLRRALHRDMERMRQIDTERVQVARSLEGLEEIRPSEKQAMARARNAILAAEERDLAFQQAFTRSWDPQAATLASGQASASDSALVYGARTPGTGSTTGSFARQRGRLPFPIAGRTEIKRVRGSNGAGTAVEMSAAPGVVVRAVYAGRVAFADDYPELGKTVILDHGDGYYSVSARLGSIDVEVGEELSAGQTVGHLGLEGRRPALTFEIRSGQNGLNTAEWFGI
jgi:septal ring factor EnvC (AmiA/AmiB activator)